jgi:Flp pilus assembly protein TadG
MSRLRTIHRLFAARSQSNERGVAAVVVAISLLVLMGFTAYALDISLGFDERRDTQNAADNSALAAAWEACNPKASSAPNPVQAARQVAALNGFDHNDPNMSVEVTQLAGNRYRVAITTTEPTHFAKTQPIGAGSLTVLSQAEADCDYLPFLGGYALFAGAPSSCNGGVQLDLSGASKIVTGGVHSNGDIQITGVSTTINGQVTHVGSSNYSPSTKLNSAIAYPIDVTFGEFQPGGTRAAAAAAVGNYISTSADINNNFMKNNGYATGTGGSITIVKSGIYYTSGDISLNSADVAPGVKVTFVAVGKIEVNGSGNFDAYEPIVGGPNDPGLLMYSNYLAPPAGPTCVGKAVQWSVSNGVWTGVIFAPHGQAKQSAASNATLNGSIFAYTVDLSGADFNITWQDNPSGDPDFRVELRK